MDDTDKVILRRLLEEAEDNNRMLKKLYHAHLWDKWMRIFYWAIIIGVSVGAFYFMQPYIDKIGDAYGVVKTQFDALQETGAQVTDTVTKLLPGGE